MSFPVDLSVDFCGRRFKNPFLLSSSPVSNSAEMVERAFLAGDVSSARARRASVASRHFDLNALIGDAPPPAPPAAARQVPSPSV